MLGMVTSSEAVNVLNLCFWAMEKQSVEKQSGKVTERLQKSGNFQRGRKWEPWVGKLAVLVQMFGAILYSSGY